MEDDVNLRQLTSKAMAVKLSVLTPGEKKPPKVIQLRPPSLSPKGAVIFLTMPAQHPARRSNV